MAPSVEIIGSTIANASLTAPPTSELVVDTSNNNTATLAPTNNDTSTNATTTTADPQSLAPTISTSPTFTPTSSAPPSAFPSSAYPTLTVVSTDRGIFRQDFVFANTTFFNESQQRALMSIFNSYTPLFAPQSNLTQRVATECTFDEQRVSVDDANKTINTVDYSCQYTSTSVNVTGFPALFYTHVGENLSELRDDMEDVGIDIVNARGLEIYQILSPAPSQSPQPSQPPTLTPTTSARPTTTPSFGPSSLPTTQPLPTTPPMFLSLPSAGPMTSVLPEGERLAVGAIAAIVILAGLTFLLLLFLYYRSWSRKREEQEMSSGGTMGGGGGVGGSSSNGGGGGTGRLPQTEASMSGLGAASSNASTIFTPRLRGSNRPGQQQHQQQQQHPLYHGAGGMGRKASSADSASLGGAASSSMPAPTVHNNPNGAASDAILDDQRENVMLSPTDSLLSNQSLLSMGDSGLADGSGEENDGTKNLQDEFDQYKDENLEQLREHVEGNLSGFEGIMSAAVTNALMGDEEANVNMQDLLWGCSAKAPGTEIEASALFEVSDWLKRNESAGGDRKRAFMQEILNKMVTSVRHGVIVAEDASRTIHESAAILGLQLAEELPMTTVIISGMRKMTTAEDMQRALHEFGDIDEAAVASGKRGFGIVRFRRRKSVDQALQRYKSGEIVILDVSIQMKVIMPSGVVESR
jgi:hypothetical protein